jgi:hypothetical protein
VIVDPDYARIHTQARIVAWQYGYACTLHGSLTRDLDLLLAPWTDNCMGNSDQVIRLIADACGLEIPGDSWDQPMKYTAKPHGRRAVSLHFPGKDRRWVDVSVMPCLGGPQA